MNETHGEVSGMAMDLTGLSGQTLQLLQDMLARRVEYIQRRNNGLHEVPDLAELEALAACYRQVNAAWFNRINWARHRRVKVWTGE